jgi:hypothetical protein
MLTTIPSHAEVASVPASSGVGLTSTCSVVNPNRFQCNFPALNGQTLRIGYISMQCGSTDVIELEAFHVLVTPPNLNSEVAYQIPITNQTSLHKVVTGSPVELYVKAGMAWRALIALFQSPSGKTQCTVSASGTPQ